MGVLYKGKEPTIFFDRATIDAIMDFFDVSDKKITVFLKAEKKNNNFMVTGWYIPRQNSTRYYNIIELDSELQILGTAGSDEDGSVYIGAMRGGEDVKSEISASDREFFDKIFNGVNEYFYCNIDKNGYISAEALCDNLVFTEVDVDIIRPFCDEEFKKQLEQEIKKKITTTAIGTQNKRTVIVPSLLRTGKKNWRDVV